MKFKEIVKVAKDWMKTNKSHSPQLMMEKDGKITVCALYFKDTEEKVLMRKGARKLFDSIKPDKMFFITESWVARDQNPWLTPSENPNREEALIITEYNKELKEKMCMTYFTRDKEGNIVFGKEDSIECNSKWSMWNFYLEEDGLQENADKSMEEAKEKWIKAKSKEITKKYYPRFKKEKTEEGRKKILDETIKEIETLYEKSMTKVVEE